MPEIAVLVLLALVLMAVSWVASALWAARDAGVSLERELLIKEQQKLMTELREFVSREVGGARSELERSRLLVRDAVGQLQRSCQSLDQESRRQGATMTKLAGQDAAGELDVSSVADG